MKKKLLILLTLLPLSLSACAAFDLTPKGGNHSSQTSSEDMKTSFINTAGGKNVLTFITLDKHELTLLPGMNAGINITFYEENETPDFSRHIQDVKWGSENEEIATIDDEGFVTAVATGNTRVYGKVFSNTGDYCTVTVIDKELDSIYVKSAKQTYIIGEEFVPSIKLIAKYKGDFEEYVIPTDIDSSAVNTAVEGKYPVTISYTEEGITKTTTYEISVVDNPTYEAKSLSYTVEDLYSNNKYGWYNPNEGDIKGLVIPIYFTDTPKYIEELKKDVPDITKEKILTDLNTSFFGEGLDDGWNSVASYYEQVSNGKVHLTGNVSGWFEPALASSDIKDEDDINELVGDAVNWYFENHPEEDMKTYDSDNNGVFDYLNIIYGRPDYKEGVDDESMYIYWGKISSKSGAIFPVAPGNPVVKFHMWASFTDLYSNIGNTPVDAHVYTHETGHTFGLEDYYDYNDDNDYRSIAGGTMMFHNTHQQDPFSTLSLGWSKVIVPETSCTIELDDYQSSHTSILLSAHPESVDSPFDEYILVELYAPNGVNEFDTANHWRGYYSSGAKEPGIRLWHVDARLAEEVSSGRYELTTDPRTIHFSDYAFSNSSGENHGPLLGPDYYEYALLFELRNDKNISYTPNKDDTNCMFSDATLFHDGDVFTLEDYSSQFINGDSLNNDEPFPWKITIENITGDGDNYKATITLEKI